MVERNDSHGSTPGRGVDRSDELAACVHSHKARKYLENNRHRPFDIDRLAANPRCPDRVLGVMDKNLLDIKFARIGARLKVTDR
jgi:hypothetical protein